VEREGRTKIITINTKINYQKKETWNLKIEIHHVQISFSNFIFPSFEEGGKSEKNKR